MTKCSFCCRVHRVPDECVDAAGPALPMPAWEADLQRAAARCEPILSAYHGWDFDSERTPASILHEEMARMTMKSSHWIGDTLSPAFHRLVDDTQYAFFCSGASELADNAYQDLMAACMGL